MTVMGIKTLQSIDPVYAQVQVDAIDAELASIKAKQERLTARRKDYAAHLPKKPAKQD
jgi:multidrug resistance efflux pump